MSIIREPFSYARLHPKARSNFEALALHLRLAHEAGLTTQLIKPFEGYRPPEAQSELVRLGTSKAKPWQSAHNYGLAVDYVPWSPGMGFNWPPAEHPDWNVLRARATNLGLTCTSPWDRPHVEHGIWFAVKRHLT